MSSEWQLRGCLGDEWQWHVAKPWDTPGWLPARVPGSVIDDLWRAVNDRVSAHFIPSYHTLVEDLGKKADG